MSWSSSIAAHQRVAPNGSPALRATRKLSTTTRGVIGNDCCALDASTAEVPTASISPATPRSTTPTRHSYRGADPTERGRHLISKHVHAPSAVQTPREVHLGREMVVGRSGTVPGCQSRPSCSWSSGSLNFEVKSASWPLCTQMELVTRSAVMPTARQSSRYTSASQAAPCSVTR